MEENQVYSDNIGKLYRDAVSRGMKADEQTFRNYLSESDENRRKVYNDLVARGMKADENQFFEYIGYPMQQPAQRVDVSDVDQGNVTDGTDRTQTSTIPPLDGGIPTVTEAQVAEMDGQQHYQPRVGGEPMKTPEQLEAEAREMAGVKTPTDEESGEPFGTERQRFAPSWGFERSQRMQDQPPAQPAPKPAMRTVNGKTEYNFSPENLQGMKEFSEGAYIKAFDEVNALMPDIERSIRERALFDTEQNNRNKSASQDAIQYHADKLAEHRIKQFRDKIEKEGVAGFDAGQMTKYLAFDDEDLRGKIESAFKDKDEADRYMQAYHQSPEWKQEQLKGLEQTDAMLQGVKQQRKQNFLKTVGGMFADLGISVAMAEGGMSQQDQQQLVKMQDDIRKQSSVNMAVNQQLHQAENTLGIARKNIEDGEGNMFVKLGRGVRYADLDNLIPVSDLYGQMGILQLYDKLDENGNPKEQLTDDEQTLYNALAMNQYVQQLYGDNVNMLNRIGRGLPEQAMFTLSFLLGSEFAGAQTIGRGATKALQRGIGNVVKKEIKSGVGKFMLDKALPTAFGMGAETLYRTGLQTGNIVSGAIERHVGTVQIDPETGEIGGFKGGVDWGEAMWKSTLSVANENFTELLGDQVFEPGWGNTKAGQRIADFRKTIGEIGDGRVDDILKMGNDISQKAGWNGWAFETLEELAGNFNDAAFIHDQTWEEAFSKETVMETVLNCMVFGMVMGSSTTTTQALRNLPSTAATRNEKRKAAAIIAGMDGISTDEIDNHIDNDSSNGLADWLVERHKAGNSNGDWTDAQRAAVANYVRASVTQKAQRHFKGMQLQEDVQKMEADVDEMTNNQSGNVIDANFEIDGQKYTGKIIGGRVSSTESDVVDANGQPKKAYTYNPYLSSATLSVIIDGTGEKKMIPSRAVTSINDITEAEQFKSERAAELTAAMQQSVAAMDEVTTVSDIWGVDLQGGIVLPYNGGVVRLDGKDADGNWVLTSLNPDGTPTEGTQPMVVGDFEFRKMGMIERLKAMQQQGSSEEEIEDAVDDINTEQTIQNIEQSGNEDNIWDNIAGFMQGYTKTNEEGDFIPEETRPEAAAGYLVALQKGDIGKTIGIVDARIAELQTRLMAKPEQVENNGEGVVGMAANQSLADSTAEEIQKQIGFLEMVRNGLVAKQAEQAQMEAQKPVSQMDKGDIFPVEMDGQRYWAQLDGHTVDGPVVSLYDNERAEGEPVYAAIDDMTDEQWEALRVNPQAPYQEVEQTSPAPISEGGQQPQEEISGKDGNISPVSPESPVEEKTQLEKDTETIMSRPNGAKLLANKIKASEKSIADAQQALGDATTAYENAKKANEEGSSASDEEMFDQETKALQEAEDSAREALDNAVVGMQSAQAEVDRWNAVRDAIEGNKSETPPAPTQEGEVPEQPVDKAPVEETPPPAAPTQEGEETSPNPSLEEGKEQPVEETPVEETPVEEAQLNPVQMSDDELLKWMERDGHGDVNKAYHTDVYDEYDSRHNDDFVRFYDEAVEEISRIEAQLEDGNSEKNDGLIQQISDIYTKADEEWDNGGSYSEQRTKLSARLAAAEEWLDKNVKGEGEPGPTDGAVAAANEEVDTNPTEAQKEAGNYKKGHVTIDGFDISIENPAGSTRSGTDAQGNPWSVTMHNSYGYIRMTEGVDGDHIDIFLSDHIDDWNGTVYVVDQVNEDGSFDEHKVMYGFNSAEEAREAYLSNYSEGWQGLGTITGVSREEFKKWVDSSHRKTKPFTEYKSVQTTEGQNEAMNTQPTEQPVQPKKEKKESEFQKRITAVGEPRTLEEAILYDIAVGGAKFRWGNRNEDKAVVKRGIGDLWKYSNNEYKKRIGIVKKDGYSIETYAEAILAGQLQPYSGAVSQIAERMDMHDIIGTIEDVLQMVTSRSGALQAIEEKRLAEAEEEENYIRSLKDAYAKELGFKDFDEMEEYYTERVGEGKDLTDDEYYEISRIFAEQYDDSVIDKEDGQESREGLDRPADSETGTNEQSGVRGEGEGGNSLLQSQQTPSDEGREQPGQETGGLQGNPHDGTAQDPSGAAEVRDEIDKLKAKRADIIRQRDDIQQRYEKANGLFGDTQADESDLFGGQNFLSPELAQATIDGYNRQIRQIDDRIAKLEASLKRAGEVKQTEIGTPAMESPENRTEQEEQKPTETREELDKRLMEERRQRILTEGTSFDKPFGLVPVSETMTVEDIDTNMQRIAEGLKANEGNKDFGNFYGFAYQGNFKENAGQQVHQYFYSLGGVVPNETLNAWAEKHGIKSKEDVVEYGKKLYDETNRTDKTDKKTEEETKKETKKQANTPIKAGPAKIDDVGEKIGGARKDLAQQMSGKIKLDADTFPKMFPKFDLKKLVEQGLDPKMAAAVMFLRQAAYAEYKQKNKRQGKDRALAAAKFFAAYAKQVLEKGDTDVEFTDSGWVFTDYGKIHMKANIALYGKIHDKMGNDMFEVDLTGYEIFPVNVDGKSTYTAYRKNEKGENVPFKPRFVTRTKSRTSYFKEDELDQAIDEVVSMVEQGVSYDKSHPYKLGVYYTRGKDNSFYVGVKIGNEVKALTEPGGLDATRAYLNEHEAELQAEAARVEQQTKEDKKKERPVAKVEIIKSDRSQGALYGYVFAVKIGKEYVNIMDDTFDLRTIYKYEKEHHDELQEKAQQMLDRYLEEKESGKGWKPQLNLGGGRARVGEDYRNGRDIGADEFRDTFGFRGVEFGNYVTQKERQRYLNEAYDAFMDLADLLGVSPKALSLGGQLGFAIGARGGGGKNAAHYEPELNVINLTKTQGAGSLAHEWWHALDFYFNQRNGERKRPATGNTVAESFDASVRREMAEAFVGLMEKVNDSEYFRRSKRLDNKTNRQYFATDTELGARAFQDYVQRRLTERGQVNDFLSSFTPEEQWNGEETTYPYPTGEEANAIDERFDNLFSTIEEREGENGAVELFSISREDWNERVIAGQDLRDEANSYGHHPSFNYDYTVNLVHGTSEENAEKIRKEGLQKGSYLAQSEEESKQHVSAKRNDNVFVVMKVDARDISYNGATNEYYAEDGLVMDADGVWVSPQRKEANEKELERRKQTDEKQLAYNAVREALANAGIEVVEATEEDVKRLKDSRKQLKDSKGTIRGWVGNDGKIHLTKDGLNAETPIHEYTHLWAEALQMNNPELWEQIKGLLKGTPEWQRITSMKEYSNLKDDDRIAGEVLAHISGKKNAERMEAEAKRMIDDAPTLEEAAKAANLLGRMRDALKKFWTWVGKTLLGKKGNINIDQVSNMVLADLTNGIDPFNPRGGKKTNRTKRTDASVESEMERIDDAYMRAVESGDMETAQRMVLEAAKAAMPNTKVVDENGNPLVVYRASSLGGNGDYTVFDESRGGNYRGFYFTNRESAERNYSGRNLRAFFLNLTNPDTSNNFNVLQGDKRELPNNDGMIYAPDGVDADTFEVKVFNPNQIKSADPVTYDDEGNVIPLSQRFNAGNPDIRFSIGDETDETDRTDVPEMSDEEAEQYDAGRMTPQEISTEVLMKVAEKNKEDLRKRHDAVRALGGALNLLRKAMSKQKEYDKATVDSIVRLARMMIENGYMDNMSRSEVKRLMTLAKNATGKTDITKQANAVVDLMLKHQLKAAEAVQQKLLATKGSKVNASGVEVQAGLDIMGQRTVKAMNEGIELDEAALTERIADVNDRMGGTDKTLAANAAEEYEGLMMAKDYHDMIRQSEQDEAQLRHELDQAKEDLKNGTLGRKEYKELAARIDAALRKNMAERVTAFTRLNQQLAEVINGSKGRAREFREKQMERVREIQHNANSDMKGTPASEHKKAARINKVVNSSVVRFLFKPVATFDEMLRFFGKKSVDGMGYLWQRFMGGYIDAADTEWRSLKKDHDALDEKVSEVMGEKMRWSDLFSMERKMEPIEVEFYDNTTNEDGEAVRVKEKHPLTQGNALYIYMVNKMDDGAMKLRRMGISDEDVDRIAGQLDPRFLQLADWIQDEFLPKKREAFNAVHMRMFGAPMAAIEEYFPLVTNSRSRGKDEDISEQDKGETKPSTITGSIIKRTVNTTPLDVTNADAFDVLLGHLRDMEHWAAFAELNRDMNTLLSYKRFKNQVLNTSSVRFGAGEALWNNFKDVCAIAADVYHPKVNAQSLDNAIVNISKGVTSAKISFRLYTALKQLLSYPAYFSEANPIELAKSTGRPANSFNWALDNLPGFAERWQSRQAGDSRLKDTDADWDFWKNKFVDTARRWGMTPNAFVDGITVAMGAKAIYESKMKGYLKAGYSEAEAKEKALKEASAAVNETQQSSQNAYLSAMQLDRTVASVALTVFRNASMGYERRMLRAVDNIKRKFTKGYKEESIEFMRKKMVREGLTEEQAKAASERVWNISIAKDVANVVIFGFVMQLAWNLGSSLMYLVFGDDDDEKEKMWEDAALHALAGPVEGLSGGNVISEVYNMARSGKKISNYNFQLLPIMSDLQTTMRHMEQDKVRGMQDIVNLVIQAVVGVNPQTITDAAVAIVDAADGDLGVGKEIGMLLLRIAQVPQSQLDQLYIDELGMSAKDAKGLPMEELAQRYAAYKRMKDAPLTGWAYSDEAKEKVDKRYVNKFVKLIQERVANMDDEALERNMDDNDDPMLKKQVGKEVASRLEGKDTYGNQPQSNWKEETKKAHLAYQQLRGYVDLCEDVVLQKAQADADKAYEAALEEGKWTEAQTQQMRAKGIEQAREQLNKMRRQLGQGNGQYDQRIMEGIRQARHLYMEYYGLKGKKE